MKIIDDFLNTITMYRLVLYVLTFFLILAEALAFLNFLPFNPYQLFFSAVVLIGVSWLTNKLLAKVFNAPINLESVYITGFILTLIITPASNPLDFIFLGLIAFLSQISKYILSINKKHIFNPTAFAVFSAFILHRGASWWVGSDWMMPAVLIGGLLIVKKIKRFSLVLSFLITSLLIILISSSFEISNITLVIKNISLETPILFFSFIMLTEPQTSPPTKPLQIILGSLVGIFLFTPFIPVNSTPELALLLGNIFSYIVSPKEKLLLKLKEKNNIAQDTYDFIFGKEKINYSAGQYMEWTLEHKNPDSRGFRRYFTLASSPTENSLRIGIKFYPNASTFKRNLVNFQKGDQIIAAQLSGEFTLPKDPHKKLCFIAGGIGITPFRSMVKYLIDNNQKRDIVLLYSIKITEEISYKDIFEKAKDVGVKTHYIVTDQVGYINDKMIKEKVSDYRERIFYISGPHSMVDTFENILKSIGIPSSQIKVDFFPGYA